MATQQGRGFEDLDCYQLALQVLKEVYKVANRLPAIERYNLADQMRRAATSVRSTTVNSDCYTNLVDQPKV